MSTMPCINLEEIQASANYYLRNSMINERSKRWSKVVQSYRNLMRLLSPEKLPPDFQPPSWWRLLMFECHCHLGDAYMQTEQYKHAITQYTKSIDSVFINKNGCLAGCGSNSCLMTPLYSRRALAYAQADDYRNASKDAEKAVVLDGKNPDVFCIRALVKIGKHAEKEALKDLDTALRYDPDHLCALILKGNVIHPDPYHSMAKEKNPYHIQACTLNSDCHNYLSVRNLEHPDIQMFCQRFLYSLTVPHTITTVSLVKRSSPSNIHTLSYASTSTGSSLSAKHASFVSMATISSDLSARPFRCGTPCDFTGNQSNARRRRDYAEAVREHVTRPTTAEEFVVYLEKRRLKENIEKRRPFSAVSSVTRHSQARSSRVSFASHVTGNRSTVSGLSQHSTVSAKSYKPKVFEKINLNDISRMYYRPWLGDRLPSADLEEKQWISPPFKV